MIEDLTKAGERGGGTRNVTWRTCRGGRITRTAWYQVCFGSRCLVRGGGGSPLLPVDPGLAAQCSNCWSPALAGRAACRPGHGHPPRAPVERAAYAAPGAVQSQPAAMILHLHCYRSAERTAGIKPAVPCRVARISHKVEPIAVRPCFLNISFDHFFL